jgi:hypothetical protein
MLPPRVVCRRCFIVRVCECAYARVHVYVTASWSHSSKVSESCSSRLIPVTGSKYNDEFFFINSRMDQCIPARADYTRGNKAKEPRGRLTHRRREGGVPGERLRCVEGCSYQRRGRRSRRSGWGVACAAAAVAVGHDGPARRLR